jgi:acetolactate synthase-1/2/3 large subunit
VRCLLLANYTVSLFTAEALRNIGVKRIYGLVGTSILDLFDTLYDYRDFIRLITVRHEQVAVSMADAEYRVSGNLGVAAVHAGPGFLNTLISLGVAFKDRVPLLLISGGVRGELKGSDAWLEVDQVAIAKPVTKMSVRLGSEGETPTMLRELLRRAFTKPRGPVMLEVPEDLWLKPVDANPHDIRLSELLGPPRHPDKDDVLNVVKIMAKAERPAIMVCGESIDHDIGGIVGEIAERLGAYIITSGSARGVCSEFNPRCLGRVGFGGGSLPANKVLEGSDALLVLGDELDDIATYRYNMVPAGGIMVVSENPVVDKRPLHYTLKVNADPHVFAKCMLESLRFEGVKLFKSSWESYLAGYLNSWGSIVEEALSRRYSGFVNPSRFFKVLGEKLPDKHIVTVGQGVHILYTYVFMKFKTPRRFLAATNLGAMGYAFPAALGAKLSLPDHEVIAVVGDGDFMMTVQDLETAVRENIPVRVVIVNDMSYRVLLLRQKTQKRGRLIGTLLGNPSFEELARAFKAEGLTVTRDEDIEYAIETMLKSDKPFIIDLKISQEDMPPLPPRLFRET